MANLQKRLAAKILKVGEGKVWMDPTKAKDISQAITRADVRRLILKKIVKKLPEKIKMPRERIQRKRTEGKRKGSKHSIIDSKTKWINTIRPLRRELKNLKSTKQIDNATYKQMRKLAKGGMFRSRAHLRLFLEQHGLLKKK
jgi:large subunit ribosomal protein L19e